METQIRTLGGNVFVRYVISGSLNTSLSFVTYSAGILLGLGYLLANFIAWILSTAVAFLLASYYVFRQPEGYRRLPLFILSNLFSLILSTATLSVLINLLLVNPILASVVTIPAVMAANFFALKHVVFR